ncbi:hypothetical protein JT358_15725 [Micrococcales bacterium 31B]|nr:hypothetical protein [Micrococcales bacterium 31B]
MPTSPLLVLDDDPTGSQCVDDVMIAFDLEPEVIIEHLNSPARVSFALTNSRALREDDALAVQRAVVAPVLAHVTAPPPLLVSRSDSTLRGHVIAEPEALRDQAEASGRAVGGILFVPAMLEAGRTTRDDVHFCTTPGGEVPVGQSHFATDATFGYRSSNLREFLEERSGGRISAADVLSITANHIAGGPDKVCDVLRSAQGAWVIVNATTYADLEIVAAAQWRLEREGTTFITRCGPSYVHSLRGTPRASTLSADALAAHVTNDPPRGQHGLIVVGSHVDLTSAQLHHLQRNAGLIECELDAHALLGPEAPGYLAETARKVRESLDSNTVVVYTSRALLRTDDPDESLAISKRISDGVVALVQSVMVDRPAWVVAKGGITSHEVARHGLGIRSARVVGQFYPGQISLMVATDAAEHSLGCPYVIFPGNVGDESALTYVVGVLRAATEIARSPQRTRA